MHIAICDDNMGDRKQLERLIKKESDRRAHTTGIIYTASFGSAESCLSNPMQYNAFYIDMCHTEGITGSDVVSALTAKGVNAPIILCCSDINYREQSFPANILFLDKPITTEALSSSIDHALSIMKAATPLIELREDTETFYVTEPDIVYALEEGRHIRVILTDGRRIMVNTTAINFYSQIEHYPTFIAPSTKTIINARHIQKLILNKAIMTDGAKFSIHRDCLKYTRKMYNELRQ